MYDKFIEYLKGKNWKYSEDKDSGIVSFYLGGTNGTTFYCAGQDEPDRHRFIFFSYCVANCPDTLRIKMAELLTRLNSVIFLGNFELNFETGIIKFKTSILYEGLDLNNKSIDNLIINNLAVMDDCTPAILKLIYGDLNAIDAYNFRQGQQQQLSN
jgi:hypothetical protein